jgi:accessory gene regulator protein AgrB
MSDKIHNIADTYSHLACDFTKDSKFFMGGKELDYNARRSIVTYMIERIINNTILFTCIYTCLGIINLFSGINVVAQCTIILITFYPLRINFGGAHLENSMHCLIVSVFLPIVFAFFTYFFSVGFALLITWYIIIYVIGIKYGCVDNPVKRLSDERKARHKKIGLIFLSIIFIINIVIYLLNWQDISDAIFFGAVIAMGNLPLGK